MPKMMAASNEPILPAVTYEYLRSGAPEGRRNSSAYNAACQFRDAGKSVDEAYAEIVPRAIADGLNQSEARQAVSSAFKSPPREPITPLGVPPIHYSRLNKSDVQNTTQAQSQTQYTHKKRKKGKIEPRQLPQPIKEGCWELIHNCFDSGEYVALGDSPIRDESGRTSPGPGTTYERDFFLNILKERDGIKNVFCDEDGTFIRVNPVTQDGRYDKDVTSFRHVLVEFDKDADGNQIPKELQYATILESNLPVAAIIDSGNKSVHAWVTVNAKNEAEYKERVDRVWDWFSDLHLDTHNRNASRYSRCPDVPRHIKDKNGKIIETTIQHLLRLNVGALTWEDWEKDNDKEELPEIQNIEDFEAEDIPEPMQIIQGVLPKGCKMALAASSKAGKTWAIQNLAEAVDAGTDWFGIPCNQGKVLYINFELHRYYFQDRSKWIKKVLQQKQKLGKRRRTWDIWNLRGYAADIEIIVDQIVQRIQQQNYDLVIIDPIYKALGDRDENSSGDITNMMNHLDRLINEIGAAIVFAAHYPKGDMSTREGIDRIAGSGAFGRDLDAIVAMSDHAETTDEHLLFCVELDVRNFLCPKAFVIEKTTPIFEITDLAKSKTVKLKKSNANPSPYNIDMIMSVLPDGKSPMEDWRSNCMMKFGMKMGDFNRLKKEAKIKKLIEQEDKAPYAITKL